MPKQYEEPPTLPLPPTWRLVVAGLVIVGFLYAMYAYEKGHEAEQTPPPATQGMLLSPSVG